MALHGPYTVISGCNLRLLLKETNSGLVASTWLQLKKDRRLQYDDAAAALASDERTAAEHIARSAEAAADKVEGRAGGTYQAQMEHAAVRGPPFSGHELVCSPCSGLHVTLLLQRCM